MEVGDVGLYGDVDFEVDGAGVLNRCDVGRDDSGDVGGFGGIAQRMHFVHFVVVNKRVKCEVTFYARIAAVFGDAGQVGGSEVGGAGAHVQLADAKVNGIRAGINRRTQRRL